MKHFPGTQRPILAYGALGVFALLLLLAIYMQLAVSFWGDQDWELLVARMLLAGKTLYADVVPVTPPLLFYLYTVPAALALHVPFLEDYQALVLLSLFAIAASIALSLKLIAPHPGFSRLWQKIQFAALLCFLLVIRMPPAFFGDREHILIVLSLPYLLRWMPSLRQAPLSLSLRITIGVLAAAGFFIKPHCLLVFAGVQIVHILGTRSLRILYSVENITLYLLGVLYAAFIALYTPQYLTLVLPMAYFTYSAIKGSPGSVIPFALTALMTFACMRLRDTSPFRRDIYYLAALFPFFYFYAFANNGWTYTYQPLVTLMLLANGFMLWEFLYLRAARVCPAWRTTLGIALCLLNFGLRAGATLDYFYDVYTLPCHGDRACHDYYQPLLDRIDATPKARSFGVFGLDFSLWTRVSKLSGAQWDTRFPQLWMVPKFYIADDAFYVRHRDILSYVSDALAEDLNRNRPDLVFVERVETAYTIPLRQPTDWVGDFSAYPAFAKAWKQYRLDSSIENCNRLPPSQMALLTLPKGAAIHANNCRYDVYRRKM